MEFVPTWWHWLVVGIVLMLAELAIPAFFVIWFGLGAVLVGLLLLVAPALSLTVQLLLWTVASVGLTVLWFRVFRTDQHKTRIGRAGGTVIGEVGLLTTPVAPFQPGQVRFQKPVLGAEQWECRAEDTIASGERVRVLSVEGSYVNVIKHH
ncbi:NfeD family protein [Denitromonas ohlonensis]|uniref:NfeD family protein n=2 Tax=Denitromonas TaxID=139331 RepID=A0A557REQ6_9RHOO|nr:NfeD family protein [Denitromonas ohlonensis]TVO63655.1 NfeD family protein [Denitromonas ohlonensis]TVO74189.1 NfeD family protein [Denitromonas ohlonensis]